MAIAAASGKPVRGSAAAGRGGGSRAAHGRAGHGTGRHATRAARSTAAPSPHSRASANSPVASRASTSASASSAWALRAPGGGSTPARSSLDQCSRYWSERRASDHVRVQAVRVGGERLETAEGPSEPAPEARHRARVFTGGACPGGWLQGGDDNSARPGRLATLDGGNRCKRGEDGFGRRRRRLAPHALPDQPRARGLLGDRGLVDRRRARGARGRRRRRDPPRPARRRRATGAS